MNSKPKKEKSFKKSFGNKPEPIVKSAWDIEISRINKLMKELKEKRVDEKILGNLGYYPIEIDPELTS